MKVGEPPRQTGKSTPRVRGDAPAEKISAADVSVISQSAQPAAVGDEFVLHGVPEYELTPRVRQALTTLLDEVRDLRRALVDSQKRMRELEQLADRDPLVDLFNRRAFVRELDRALAMIDRYGVQASLIFVDLNDLKSINDAHGHNAGDAAIAHVASVLSRNVRQTDIVGRLGGDEFGVLLTQADKEIAEAKAVELSGKIANVQVNGPAGKINVTISHGVVEIRPGGSSEAAMEAADIAMYSAKKNR